MRATVGRPSLPLSLLLALSLTVMLAPAQLPADDRGGIEVDTGRVAEIEDDRCSLIEAINNANAGADTSHGDCWTGTRGPDNIVLLAERFEVTDAYPARTLGPPPAGLSQAIYFPIAIAPPVPGRGNGLPVITSDITIIGGGAQIVRHSRAPNVRLFEVAPSGRLALEDLTLRGGKAHGGVFDTAKGGAVLVGGGRLEATRCRFVANASNDGGAIAVLDGSAALTDSWIAGNEATGGDGGGIMLRSKREDASLEMTGGGITVNRASRDGGGVFVGPLDEAFFSGVSVNGNEAGDRAGGVFVSINAAADFAESEVSDNSADYGGAFYAIGEGWVDVRRSEIARNSALNGGAVYIRGGIARFADSTVVDNEAHGHAGGGVYHESGDTELVGTTVSGNRALCGGGIVSAPGYGDRWVDVSLVSSTVSGNRADCGAAGIYNGGVMSITASTVAANVSEPFGDWRDELPLRAGIVNGPTEGEFGLGLPSIDDPVLELAATLVAGHVDGLNCHGGGIRSLGHNLEAGTSCGFGATGDVVGVDARMGALADNGGPTLTHALYSDSPARDAIPRGIAGCGTTLTADQRGLPRPESGRDRCDIGAFELQPGR